jgi:hypothetical protein
LGRKLLEREAIARAYVAKAAYNHPFTRTTIRDLSTMPNLRRICGFERIADIPSESTFTRAFADSDLGAKVHEAGTGWAYIA